MVELLQRFGHSRSVDGDGAIGSAFIDEIAGQRLDIPSKMTPTTSPFALIAGEPELPPMMSFVVTKSSAVPRFSLPTPSL